MRKYTLIVSFCTFFLPVLLWIILGSCAPCAAQSRPGTYFSSGQAVYDPQDRARSQQQAIQDFMAQGLTQAISSFLSPAQMGAQFAEIQKKVLARPEKYIDSYRVFSEEQTGGVFRVLGQVTVAMDALKEDLVNSGILTSRQETRTPSAPSPAIGAPPEATGNENAQNEEGAASGSQKDSTPSEPGHRGIVRDELPASQPPQTEQEAGRQSSRGIIATKREILWVVSEKWHQEWVLPTEGSDVSFLFARSLSKEMDDLDFSILFPRPGSVRMDLSGNIPPSQAISLAEGLGIQDVVVGRVSYIEDRNTNQVSLDAGLRVIRIAQGKSEFEIHKTQSMEDLSNRQGARELAGRIAPELSGLLGGARAGGAAGASTPGPEPSSAQTERVGPLLIHLPSSQYSYWMELEAVLREQFKDMQRTGVEIGSTQSAVKLDGVSGQYILQMSGTRLPSGATVRIDSYSTEAHTMKVSFEPPGKVQAETR